MICAAKERFITFKNTNIQMKKINLIAALLLLTGAGSFAQTARKPMAQLINDEFKFAEIGRAHV